jgi:hypothetical protein
LEDEFRDTKFSLSSQCMETLERIGVYKPPVDGALKGTFENVLFRPTRHDGRCDPKAKENMSPVIPEIFGATRSMQNAQVMTTMNGVARYVVKYLTDRDQNNQITVAPSVHNSANMRVDTKFLHNTKITCSRINEENHTRNQIVKINRAEELFLHLKCSRSFRVRTKSCPHQHNAI